MNAVGNLFEALGDGYEETITAQPGADFGPIPSGVYPAIITDSGFKATKAADGSQYLELTHQIIDGPYKNRLVWARLNLKNKSKIAKDIADGHLAQIRVATGIERPNDSSELHNIPLLIRVEFVPANQKNKNDGNEIKAWKSLNDADANAQAQADMTRTVAQQAPAANTAPTHAPAAVAKPATPAAPAKAAWAR